MTYGGEAREVGGELGVGVGVEAQALSSEEVHGDVTGGHDGGTVLGRPSGGEATREDTGAGQGDDEDEFGTGGFGGVDMDGGDLLGGEREVSGDPKRVADRSPTEADDDLAGAAGEDEESSGGHFEFGGQAEDKGTSVGGGFFGGAQQAPDSLRFGSESGIPGVPGRDKGGTAWGSRLEVLHVDGGLDGEDGNSGVTVTGGGGVDGDGTGGGSARVGGVHEVHSEAVEDCPGGGINEGAPEC